LAGRTGKEARQMCRASVPNKLALPQRYTSEGESSPFPSRLSILHLSLLANPIYRFRAVRCWRTIVCITSCSLAGHTLKSASLVASWLLGRPARFLAFSVEDDSIDCSLAVMTHRFTVQGQNAFTAEDQNVSGLGGRPFRASAQRRLALQQRYTSEDVSSPAAGRLCIRHLSLLAKSILRFRAVCRRRAIFSLAGHSPRLALS
jgi:hypothetical protein